MGEKPCEPSRHLEYIKIGAYISKYMVLLKNAYILFVSAAEFEAMYLTVEKIAFCSVGTASWPLERGCVT